MALRDLEQKLAVAELSNDLKDYLEFSSSTDAEQFVLELTSIKNDISEKLQELKKNIAIQRGQLNRFEVNFCNRIKRRKLFIFRFVFLFIFALLKIYLKLVRVMVVF